MGKNIEVVYSLTFCVADRYNKEHDPTEKENLRKELDGLAKDYDYWKNAKFLFGWGKKEEYRQGYLRLVEEFRGLKEGKKVESGQSVYTSATKGQDATQVDSRTEKPNLETKLSTGQTQQKDPWVLFVVYKETKEESRFPFQTRETLIKAFQMIDNSLIIDKNMAYPSPDGNYSKTKDPNQLPKK